MIKLKPRTRIILLSVISILIVVTIVLGVTYSFMQANIDSSSVTEVSLSSCAKITLSDTEASIDLSNTSPISKNRALETTPYTFTVTSSCESYVGFNLYLATLNTNTLVDSSIHYIITKQDSKDILAEGILSEATNALSEFTAEEQTQLNNGIKGTFGTIYRIYNDSIPLQGSVSYDLYLYIDSDVIDASTMGQTFNAGIAVKSYDREATFAEYLTTEVYTGTDGDNGLYYHDGQGTYTNADQEASDNSYRFAGANPNNYVCFGSDEETCPADNLYRIIGVFGYQMKLIKHDYANSDLLGTNGDYGNTTYTNTSSKYYKGSKSTIDRYYWNNNLLTNQWSQSNLNIINLNTNYLDNIGNEWSNLIAMTNWKVGGNTYSKIRNVPVKQSYHNEIENPVEDMTYSAKIGLMYVSDYGYAASPENWTVKLGSLGNDTNRNNNWMFMGLTEWTITRYSDSEANTILVNNAGVVNFSGVGMIGFGIRPVFYLNSDVVLESGIGTYTDPYRIL